MYTMESFVYPPKVCASRLYEKGRVSSFWSSNRISSLFINVVVAETGSVGPSGGVVLLLLDAASAAGSPLHGVGGGVQRGAGRRLIAGSVVDQVLRE